MLKIRLVGGEMGNYSRVLDKRIPFRHHEIVLTNPEVRGMLTALAQYESLKKQKMDTLTFDLGSGEWYYESTVKED